MAADMFLKIEGITGDSEDKNHPNEIEVVSWAWSMTNPGAVSHGTAAGKVDVHDLSITKLVDSASHALIHACCSGKHFKDARLVVRKAGADLREYLKIELTDVYVTGVENGGREGAGMLTETITLNCARFKYAFSPQRKDGNSNAPKETIWDIKSHARG